MSTKVITINDLTRWLGTCMSVCGHQRTHAMRLSTRPTRYGMSAAAAGILALTLTVLPERAAADNLHGYFPNVPITDCQDNGNITPIVTTNTPNFGFSKMGGSISNTGTFYLDVLLPDNIGTGKSFAITALGGTQFNTVSSSDMGDWQTGKL